jgi:CheY-like chemotaxis protein
VAWPLAKQESPEAHDAPSESPAATFAGKRPHVLIVDDEPILTRGLARALAPYCDVDIANSGDEGIARVAASDPPVDAVVCDIMMPGMSGIEFADLLASRDPQLRRRTLFMTGGAVTPAAMAFVQRADVRCLHKPIAAGELAEEISRLLASV